MCVGLAPGTMGRESSWQVYELQGGCGRGWEVKLVNVYLMGYLYQASRLTDAYVHYLKGVSGQPCIISHDNPFCR